MSVLQLNFFQVLGFLENTLNVSQEILDRFRNEKVSVHYILVKLCLKIHLITSVWFFVCHLLILFNLSLCSFCTCVSGNNKQIFTNVCDREFRNKHPLIGPLMQITNIIYLKNSWLVIG